MTRRDRDLERYLSEYEAILRQEPPLSFFGLIHEADDPHPPLEVLPLDLLKTVAMGLESEAFLRAYRSHIRDCKYCSVTLKSLVGEV